MPQRTPTPPAPHATLAPRPGLRRGSALLIVIGVLALVAVLGAIYISIGQADNRSAAALQRADRTGQFPLIIGDHVATTIARDRLDTYMIPWANAQGNGANPATIQTSARETWDYPYTDWSVRSVDTGAFNGRLFNPTGAHTGQANLFGASPANDPRVPYDPWLASTEPEYLGPYHLAGDPNARIFSRVGGGPPEPRLFWLDRRDWRHITNLAPDGRFVNLFNLRPQENPEHPGVFGGFDAEPGVHTYTKAGRNRAHMTYGLTLLDVHPDDRGAGKDARIFAFEPGDTGTAWLPGAGAPVSLGLPPQDLLNIPAVWDSNQRYSFFPLNQPFFAHDRNLDVADWRSPDYLPYQWADADGDGMADSRWFELTDVKRINNRLEIFPLEDDPDYRVFAAVRVMDLSALVNVNTAGDQTVRPTFDFPTGASPAEVDLRRLLMMTDQAERWSANGVIMGTGSAGPGTGLSLGNIDHPSLHLDPDLVEMYHGYGVNQSDIANPSPDMSRPDKYYGFLTKRPGTDVLAESTPLFSNELLGAYSYDALRLAINAKADPDNRYVGIPPTSVPFAGQQPTDLFRLRADSMFAYDMGQAPRMDLNDPVREARRRYQYGKLVAPLDVTRPIDLQAIPAADDAGSPVHWGASLFGLADLEELLTYRGVNDPAVTSRLERVLSGRLDNSPLSGRTVDSSRRLSPALWNRPLNLDRFGHGDGRRKVPDNGRPPFPRVEGQIDAESMALFALSPRLWMTTYNGAAAIKPSRATPGQALTEGDAVSLLSGVAGNPAGAFGVYAAALAPYSGLRAGTDMLAWYDDMREADLDPSTGMYSPNPYRTLNYGGVSAEQALRIAGHLAVNMAAAAGAAGADGGPPRATLLLDNQARDTIEQQQMLDPQDADLKYYWAADGEQFLLDRGASELAGNVNGSSAFLTDPRRRAVNVFGVTPQPFLVEVASIMVFTDSPTGAGGDDDSLPFDCLAYTPGGPFGGIPNITIDTSADWANSDMALHLIAFKLTNPFSEPVTLGVTWRNDNDPNVHTEVRDAWEPDYYIEYAGRFFALGNFVEFDEGLTNTPTIDGVTDFTEPVPADRQYRPAQIPPGQSRVFYVLANDQVGHGVEAHASLYDFKAVDDRWTQIMGSDAPGNTDNNVLTGPAWEWVTRQLRTDTGQNPLRIKEFDPETGKLVTPVGNWRDLTQPNAFPVPAIAGNTTRINKTGVVRLWRRLQAAGEDNGLAGGDNFNPGGEQYNVIDNDLLADRLTGENGPMDRSLVIADGLPTTDVIDDTVSFGGGLASGVPYEPGYSVDCTSAFAACNGAGDPTRNDNTGWSIALWGTIRRPVERGVPFAEGHLPTWLLEVRHPTTAGSATTTPSNISISWRNAFPDMANRDWRASDFAELLCPNDPPEFKDPFEPVKQLPDREIRHSLRELWNQRANKPVVPTLAISPGGRPDAGDGGQPDVQEPVGLKFRLNESLGTNAAGAEIDYADANDLQPEWHVPGGYGTGESIPAGGGGTQTVSRLRPADLLLAMGIGPVQAPPYEIVGATTSPPLRRDVDPAYDIDAEWLTLSEMLAIALGYDEPAGADLTLSVTGLADPEFAKRLDDPYVGLVNNWTDLDGNGTADADEWRYALPGLRLSIDDFVPYFDVQPATMAPLEPFTYGPAAGDFPVDVPAGGMPMALDVLARVRQHDPWEPANAATDWRLTRPLPGVININTAPAHVLRMLPGLTPAFESFDANGDTIPDTKEWWLAQHGGGGGKVPTLAGTDKTLRPDIAAAIVAYRDRLIPELREASDPFATTMPPMDRPELGFGLLELSRQSGLIGAGHAMAAAADARENLRTDQGRHWTTGIAGIRETPGFRGVGEVLAVTMADEYPSGDPANPRLQTFDSTREGMPKATYLQSIHNTIQSLGLDGAALDSFQVDSNGANPTPAFLESDVYDGNNPDDIEDELGERLAIANGILGSISVSSDVYAAWFVVHAYRESDVADLKPGDPLIPSYARRFLMVIDRSTVTSEDDTPRILLFREVPM